MTTQMMVVTAASSASHMPHAGKVQTLFHMLQKYARRAEEGQHDGFGGKRKTSCLEEGEEQRKEGGWGSGGSGGSEV